MSTRKSIPFLNVSLETITIFILFKGNLLVGSGVNLNESTALGIADILSGDKHALYKIQYTLSINFLCWYVIH